MNRFRGVSRLECNHLISNSEFNAAFTQYRDTLREYKIIGNYEYNFFKVFSGVRLTNLDSLAIINMRKDISDLDVTALSKAAQ